LVVIGQFIALKEDDLSIRYLTEYDLLSSLQWILVEGNAQVRKDALWII
jgi:hypothetical protein